MTRPARPSWPVCYHEAGHAVAAVVLGLGLRYVRVWDKMWARRLSDGTWAHCDGRCNIHWPSVTVRRRVTWRRYHAVMLLSGHISRDEYHPISLRADVGSWSDLAQVAWTLRLRYARGCSRKSMVRRQTASLRGPRREARSLLRDHWPAVRAVARALQRRCRLTGAEVRRIVAGGAVRGCGADGQGVS